MLSETPGADAGDGDSDRSDPALHVWRRSSRCGTHGACVEVADLADGAVAVRDGKTPATSPVLVFGAEEWIAFIAGVKTGEFS